MKAQELNLSEPLSRQDINQYLQSLNDYFKVEPYSWYSCFEPLLNGLNASYYPNRYQNRVLHTDIYSPFATDVIWKCLLELLFGISESGCGNNEDLCPSFT